MHECLQERDSILRCTYIAFLLFFVFGTHTENNDEKRKIFIHYARYFEI